jgi:hypothetical protein
MALTEAIASVMPITCAKAPSSSGPFGRGIAKPWIAKPCRSTYDFPGSGAETGTFRGDVMQIRIIALAAGLALAVPAASAQQVDTPKQSLSARLKQKYLERRAKFMHRVKDVYFAMGCKVLAREAGIQALTSADSYLAYVGDQTIIDLKDDEALRKAAMQEGLERSEKPGECDYYRRHPEAAAAIRRAAGETAKR